MKSKKIIDTFEKGELIKIIKECHVKLNRIPPKSLEYFEMSSGEIEICFECVIDAFMEFGFDLNNDEPNDYGVELNKAIYSLQFMMD